MQVSPEMTFCYVSGEGTDSSEKGRLRWARVKGKTENDLLRLPFKAAYMLRPGFIQPLKGVKSKTALYQSVYVVLGWLYPVLHALLPRYTTTTVALGRTMIVLAASGDTKHVLTTADINRIGARGMTPMSRFRGYVKDRCCDGCEADTMLKVLSLAGVGLMVLGLVGLFSTSSLFSPNPIVIAIQAAAVALMIWARVTFGRRSFHAAANPTAGGLVVDGPYHFIRHPIYTSICFFCGAGAMAHPSATSLLFGVCILAGAILRMLCEERLVVVTYPEYLGYAATTKRMVPFLF